MDPTQRTTEASLWMFDLYHRVSPRLLCSTRVLAWDALTAKTAFEAAQPYLVDAVELVEPDEARDHGISYVVGASVEDAPSMCSAMLARLNLTSADIEELLAREPGSSIPVQRS